MTGRVPACEDTDAIKRRIDELEAERRAAWNCCCPLDDRGVRTFSSQCPAHSGPVVNPAACIAADLLSVMCEREGLRFAWVERRR